MNRAPGFSRTLHATRCQQTIDSLRARAAEVQHILNTAEDLVVERAACVSEVYKGSNIRGSPKP